MEYINYFINWAINHPIQFYLLGVIINIITIFLLSPRFSDYKRWEFGNDTIRYYIGLIGTILTSWLTIFIMVTICAIIISCNFFSCLIEFSNLLSETLEEILDK